MSSKSDGIVNLGAACERHKHCSQLSLHLTNTPLDCAVQ